MPPRTRAAGKGKKKKPQQAKARRSNTELVAAREWLSPKCGKGKLTGGSVSVDPASGDAVVSFSAVAAMAMALSDLKERGARMLFPEPAGWKRVRGALVSALEEAGHGAVLTNLEPRYVFPKPDGSAEVECRESHELVSKCSVLQQSVDAGRIIRAAEKLRAATVPRRPAATNDTPARDVGLFRIDTERGGVVVLGATAVPRPAEGCRSVWPAGYREGVPPLLEEWQGCVKRIEELTEEYTKHRNRVCLGNTMRGKPSSFLEEYDEDDRGPQSIENLLRDIQKVAQSCRHQIRLDLMTLKRFFKNEGSDATAKEMSKEYAEKRQRLEVVEAKLEASVRSQPSADERDVNGEAKKSGHRRRQGRAAKESGGGDQGDNEEQGSVELLALHEKASQEYEDVLLRTLGRLSSLSVRHTRQSEVREVMENLDTLLHKISKILDTSPGSTASGMTNQKVLEVIEDTTLRDFFQHESRRVLVTSRQLAVELDRKDRLLARLREDPLLTALYCAVHCELESRARRQREIEAEVARQQLLQEEEAAGAKQDARLRRKRQQQGAEEKEVHEGRDEGDIGGKTVGVLKDKRGSPTNSETKTEPATPTLPTEEVAKEALNAPAGEPTHPAPAPVATAPAAAAKPDKRRASCSKPSPAAQVTADSAEAPAVWETPVEAEDPWEVSAKKVKPKQRPGKRAEKDAVGAETPLCHLVDAEGQLVPIRGNVCRLYLRNDCTSAQCDKVHPAGRIGCRIACDYFLTGRCTRGKQCRYAHVGPAVLAQFQSRAAPTAGAAAAATPGGSTAAAAAGKPGKRESAAEVTANGRVKVNGNASAPPAAVTTREIDGGREVVTSAGRVTHLAATFTLLSQPAVRQLLQATPTHAHITQGGCMVCALSRLTGLWGDTGLACLSDAAEDVRTVLESAVPGTHPSVVELFATLDLVRMQCDPCSPDDPRSTVGALFGVRVVRPGASVAEWSLAFDADLASPNAVPRPQATLGLLSVCRIDGWSPDRCGWLCDLALGKLAGSAVLGSLGYDTPPTVTSTPRLAAVLLDHSTAGAGVVLLPAGGPATAVLWTDRVVQCSSPSAPNLLVSLVQSPVWVVTALVFCLN